MFGRGQIDSPDGRLRSIVFLHGSNDLYGASRVLEQDVEVFVELGWDTRVVLPAEGPLTARLRELGATVDIEDLTVLRKVNGLRGLRVPLRLPSLATDADVVVVWTLALSGYALPGRTRGKIVITSVHEILEGRSGTLLARGSRAFSHGVMTNSETTRAWYDGCGSGRGKASLVAYPVAPAYEPLRRDTTRPWLSLLLAGRINGHKGHIEAVRAVRAVRADGVDIRLVLAGGVYPGQEEHLLALQREIEGESWVDLVGEVADVRPLLQDADAMLVPTTQPEPFGVVALEAWSAGRRVIASDSGGLAEAVRLVDGMPVKTDDPNALQNAIREIADSSELRGAPSGNAKVGQTCTLDNRRRRWSELLGLSVRSTIKTASGAQPD